MSFKGAVLFSTMQFQSMHVQKPNAGELSWLACIQKQSSRMGKPLKELFLKVLTGIQKV